MLGMRKVTLIFVFVFGVCAAPCLQAGDGVSSFFPERFGHWTASSAPVKVQGGPDTANAMKAYNDAFAEAGLTDSIMKRTYSDGRNEIQVVLGKFRDPSGAYEAYTAALQPGMKPSSLGSLSAVGKSQLLAQIGNLMMGLYDPRNISDADLHSLVLLLREHADKTPLPPVRTYLPESDLIDGTQRYTLGPIGFQNAMAALQQPEAASLSSEVGFASGAEAMFGRYRSGKDEAVLLLLEYPTPQLAELRLRHLEIALPHSAREAGTPIERKGSLLAIVLSPSSAHYAKSLRNAVNYETQVTWNEPSQTLTDPPWASVIAQIFIGTGVFMVAAVVLGIAFGGLRVVTKIYFPGKVFDRPERMEILQLGLSGKRIDPSDFY
jgi:hypothetical protein